MLPTTSDFGDLTNLDIKSAWDHFGNKTLAEAELLFRENSLHYQEDLMWMGAAAFHYYFPAAIRYVQSEFSSGDSDLISCLVAILEFRTEYLPESLASDRSIIRLFCDYVLENHAKFDLTAAEYENVQSRLIEIVKNTETGASPNSASLRG